VAACRAGLQRAARSTGVLRWIEEAVDTFSLGIHAAGASNAKLDERIRHNRKEKFKRKSILPLKNTLEEEAAARNNQLASVVENGGSPLPAPSTCVASAVLGAIYGSNTRALVNDLSPALFAVLATGASQGIPLARACLAQLNYAPQFPPKLLRAYSDLRALVPQDDPRFWRSRCLDLETSLEDMRRLVQMARRRKRAAEKHRASTGAYPRRVRLLTKAERLGGQAADFAKKTNYGGPAFWGNPLDDDPNIDYVAIAFDSEPPDITVGSTLVVAKTEHLSSSSSSGSDDDDEYVTSQEGSSQLQIMNEETTSQPPHEEAN